jgi:FkbM family methyltransferase
MGRRAALALRKVVLRAAGPTIDAEVEGLRLRLYPRGNVCERKFLFMPRMFDPVERALIDAELPADGVFVDIGANVGLYTLWAARRLGEQGRVLALEPNPVAFGRLTVNLALNGLAGRVTALQWGVADREGAFELHLDATNLGGGSLVETGGETIRVPCKPLDDLLAAHGIARVDILKIDVEGAEELVLPPFLERAPAARRPRTILIEESSARWRGDLIGTLEGHGYRVAARTRMNLILRLEAGD